MPPLTCTRRINAFDRKIDHELRGSRLVKRMSRHALDCQLHNIWCGIIGQERPMPELRILPVDSDEYSHYHAGEYHTIWLRRDQQDLRALIHETVHALTPTGYHHGRVFQEKYLAMLLQNAEHGDIPVIVHAAFETGLL